MAMAMRLSESDWMSCCGSSRFAKEMVKIGPFEDLAGAIDASRQIWWNKVDVPGWLEAFGAHPRIGGLSSSATTDWCAEEQATALGSANDREIKDLAAWNRLYESRFGFVFLVCATGKSSSEILQILKLCTELAELRRVLQSRMKNRPLIELQVAASEQQKITELRLAKLLSQKNISSDHPFQKRLDRDIPLESPPNREHSGTFRTGDVKVDGRLNKIEAHVSGQQPQASLRPPITTHVLDVSLGRPAASIAVSLDRLEDETNSSWTKIGTSITNHDGRSGPLMKAAQRVDAGTYRLTFDTGNYLSSTSKSDTGPFYPYVSVVFDIKPSQVLEHFHVPVLLSPFGFTTYRGS